LEALYSPAVIQRLLKDYGLRPNKALGQNFLADRNTVQRIVRAAAVGPGDLILEIGPGLGSLTQGLLEAGARVIAVEKDAGLARALSDLFQAHPGVTIVHGDALKVDFADLVREHGPALANSVPGQPMGAGAPSSFKIVANLPYYITSPLLLRILETDPALERAVVMIQREVAERLVAAPGSKEYGALAVAVRFRAHVELAGVVPPTVFVPMPSVSSEIVVMTPRSDRPHVGPRFSALVKAAFGQRRKTLRNALKALGLSSAQIDAALAKAGLDGERRGETLSVEEFAILSTAVDDAARMI